MARRWENGASPAAAAAVSRVLKGAGIKKAVEVWKGVESVGYAVEPEGDHVRVEFVPGLFEAAGNATRVAAGLDQCATALTASGYRVERVIRPIAQPGGWQDGEVLEVRPASSVRGES